MKVVADLWLIGLIIVFSFSRLIYSSQAVIKKHLINENFPKRNCVQISIELSTVCIIENVQGPLAENKWILLVVHLNSEYSGPAKTRPFVS